MRYAISTIIILLFFSSCSDKSKNNITVLKVAEEGLQRSNKNISIATEMRYKGLEEKLYNLFTTEQAKIWQPKAMIIKDISESMIKYINGLKEELKTEAGGNDDKNENWKNKMGISDRLFVSQAKGKELLKRLIKYKEDLLAVDTKMKSQLGQTIVLFSDELDFTSADTTRFTKVFFSNMPVIAANLMLSKFENNVKICENEFVTYCYYQIGSVDGYSYTNFSPLVGQSSNCVKAGDKITLTAGVGAFSIRSSPKITIDKKDINVYPDGMAIYEFKTPVKAGKYFKAVKIEYNHLDGTKLIKTFNIDYTVIEPK